MKLKTALTSLSLGLCLAVGSAQAATISQLLSAYPEFRIEDDSVESIHIDSGTTGVLDVGDTLRGIAEFDKLNDRTSVLPDAQMLPSGGNNTLSAIFELKVLSKTQTAGQATAADPTDDLFSFTFGPEATFAYGPDNALGGGDDYATGAMIAFYEDPVHDFAIGGVNCTSAAVGGDCEQNVTDGTLAFVLGMTGADADEAWIATDASDNIAGLTAVSGSSNVGSYNFFLSVLFSNVGTFNEVNILAPFADGVGDNKIDFVGSGSLQGTGDTTTPYQAQNDAQLTGERAIPEPATVALLGIGLVGLGTLRRRRRA